MRVYIADVKSDGDQVLIHFDGWGDSYGIQIFHEHHKFAEITINDFTCFNGANDLKTIGPNSQTTTCIRPDSCFKCCKKRTTIKE